MFIPLRGTGVLIFYNSIQRLTVAKMSIHKALTVDDDKPNQYDTYYENNQPNWNAALPEGQTILRQVFIVNAFL